MKLHPIQEKILELHTHRARERRWTRREVQEELGVSSVSVVQHHYNELVKKGYLKPSPLRPGQYVTMTVPEIPLVYLNTYGKAKCGPGGSILTGHPEDRIGISSRLLRGKAEDAFVVQADGDSMLPEIKDNDLVIGTKIERPENGQIVIGALDESPFIKRFKRINSEQILLESLNPDYEAMVATPDNNLVVEGLYIGLIRNS